MRSYAETAVEKAMTRQEILLRAYAKTITWIQAAEILGISCRHLRRIRERFERVGYDGLFDRRIGKASPKRIRVEIVEEVLSLYRDKYFDLNVKHYHEKLTEEHGLKVSYTWTKGLLQGAGLVAKDSVRKKHRRRRDRRPLKGMMLHIDGSHHQWFGDERWHDLIVILDDATSEIYYAQMVKAESTSTVMQAIREVVEKKGIFCSLYSDRARHFWVTAKSGEPVDRQAMTQVGRALRDIGINMIPAYSPQARGRSERSFKTWQGRLPQELRLRGIATIEEANLFLKRGYIRQFNRKFTVQAAEPEGSAFVPCTRSDLDRVFSIQTERTVGRDNTVTYKNMTLQVDKQSWRRSMDGCRVIVYQHLDQTITIGFGPQVLGRYAPDGRPKSKAVEMTRLRKTVKDTVSLNRLEKSRQKTARLSHISTATTTANDETGHLMCY
jgi:transposase